MQMLFIIPLLKTENPYYIIVNILTDNGENTMQNEKTSVLVLAQCDLTMRETLNTRFGTQCAFTFAENGEHPTAEQLRAAAVIFGEPSEAQLAQTENLRLLQLTWAGADKYTRMANLPQSGAGECVRCVRHDHRGVRDWQSGGAVPLVWTVLEQ